VPQSPVDGATFSTYLDGLAIQAVDPNATGPGQVALSDLAYSSPLSVFRWQGSGYLAAVSAPTAESSAKASATLTFTSTDGISVGAYVFSSDVFSSGQPTIPSDAGLQVSEVTRATASTPGTVTLRHGNSPASLPSYVPAATVVTFLGTSPSANPATAPPEVFTLPTTAPASTLDGQPESQKNPLRILHFDAADSPGITVGMNIAGDGIAPGTTVAQVHVDSGPPACAVTVSPALTGSPASVTFTLEPPFASFDRTPLSGTPTAKPQTLTFAPGGTDGIAVGMTLKPAQTLIAAGTAVTAVTSTTVSLSRPLLKPLPANADIGFVFPLSSGIFQHVEQSPEGKGFLGLEHPIIPAAVATAILPLLDPPPPYLAVRIVAARGAEIIPISTTFHNMLTHPAPPPTTPYDYQAITPDETGLYVALPPQPGANPISLAVPEDGSPPPFDLLLEAMRTALRNDPIPGATLDTLISSPAQCRRVAYDIVWSSQNALPAPPDPLEFMYTNPPNPGGGGGNDSMSSDSQNNFEQDRQKFEGELNSFYSTRDANAERLAKFVAAVSAARQCEQSSLNAAAALVTFPVDAAAATYGTAVGSELVLEGLGAAGLAFGVPAAFFYALGAHLDKSTTALQRYEMATGDAIERLLQQLSTAVDSNVISAVQAFSTTGVGPGISAFQAARRLSALSVSAASAAARATVVAGSPLATLTTRWLAFDTPAAAAANPPPTYAQIDFTEWRQLATAEPAGYLALDLQALTEGYAIPTVTLRPTQDAAAGAVTLTFAADADADLAQGTPLSGPGLTAGATVSAVMIDTSMTPPIMTVTLSSALQAAVTTTTDLTVNASGTTLADQIAAWLPGTTSPATAVPTVTTLRLVTAQQWSDFFTLVAGPAWLPPFTLPVIIPGALPAQVDPKPGYLALRVRAFVRAVQRFFTVSSLATTAKLPDVDAPPTFDGPVPDLVGQVVSALPAGFAFGTPLSAADLDAAVQGLGEDLDPAVAAWLTQTVVTINELSEVAAVTPAPDLHGHSLPYPVSLAFSVTEALYARGFHSAADITALSQDDFRLAMTGTIAYDFAAGPKSLYAKAHDLAQSQPPSTPVEAPFAPVNPDGSLVDCTPPATLSPTGPIGYLQDLLRLSPESTCAQPFPVSEKTSLGGALAARRGALGDLRASEANLQDPVPLADLVNECLEYLGATQPAPDGAADSAPRGTVYDTDPAAAPLPPGRPQADCLAAMPQHSTPAPPSAGPDQAVSPLVYDRLKNDFSSCRLPYAQALDVCQTYLRHLGSSRFEEMRTFRKCITEFVLDPARQPAGFQPWLWRYPVRTDVAIEFLGITPEEYAVLFEGDQPPPCLPSAERRDANAPAAAAPAAADATESARGNLTLPAFLALTCLTYCEFHDLWQSGYVAFHNGAEKAGAFPACEPCCPEDLWLRFPDERQEQDLPRLLLIIRLWRTLRQRPGGEYSFAQLRQICEVLQLYDAGGGINPDFVRQLAAFQMLREHFGLDLVDRDQPPRPVAEADRVDLLALWVGAAAPAWSWALRELVAHVERHARGHYPCRAREPEFRKVLVSNLDRLSRLAGFDPASATDSWHARPTHTLRFAEVLSKIYASDFSVGELVFLFTADDHLDGDDPFPLPPSNEALDSPLTLPDDDHRDGLWQLRRALLAAAVGDGEEQEWSWERIAAALHVEFGFAPDDVTALGQHFFPARPAGSGPASARFVSDLPAADTSAAMWNSAPEGPLRYDAGTGQLSARLPLKDRSLVFQLQHVRDLNPAEQKAVQDLYFQPRALLARFALLFEDAAAAIASLVEQDGDVARFEDFRRAFLLCRQRCQVIAAHLSRHVRDLGGPDDDESEARAAAVLRALAADENMARTSWEDDSGAPPALTWPVPPGSALAALLGLVGTGLVAEFRTPQGALAWRDVAGALSGFGRERDRHNSPVPTVLPGFNATLPARELHFASVHNGYLLKDRDDAWLGGAEGFAVTWSGALLVDEAGTYEFWAGPPSDDGRDDEPPPADSHRHWRIVLRRGQRSWVVLTHHWEGEPEHRASSLPLRRGAYDLTVELTQEPPRFGRDDEVGRQGTGLEVTYRGPDTDAERVAIPHHRLFTRRKHQALGAGVTTLSPAADAYLAGLYQSSLRDIRRTYQRAFKALLLTGRFALSPQRHQHETSELAYLLDQASLFAGASYYRSGTGFTRHAANLDVDFLPLLDDYLAPDGDARTAPTPQRSAALFDWWERLFDYGVARADVRRRTGHHLWHLFSEARDRQPAHPGHLLSHLGADERHWPLDLRYFQSQDMTPGVYAVTSADLQDERWTLRAWRADAWLRSLERAFTVPDITLARPALWASDDPAAALTGETTTGNANLWTLVTSGFLDTRTPGRGEGLARLNDELRERGRQALIAYLCTANRVALPWAPGSLATGPADLSDLLLLDVKAGPGERATRIEEAITAVQSFVRRSRLGLEPDWTAGPEFARLWDSRFATYRTWELSKRRELYRENWIEWDDLEQARRIEAFRFLESELRTSTLALAAPGGLDWWPNHMAAGAHRPELLQKRVPSELRPLTAPPQAGTREGLSTLGLPEAAASPTWLAATPPPEPIVQPPPEDGPVEAEVADPRPIAALAASAAVGAVTPASLPLWMESAAKLGTRFLRVAAAGPAPAALGFHPHTPPSDLTCCRECGCEHPIVVDEYYFWLIDAEYYSYGADTDSQDDGPSTFAGSYQFGFQDSYYDRFQQQSAEWNDADQVPPLLAKWKPEHAVRLAWSRVHNGEFGQPRRSQQYVPIASPADLVLLGRAGDSLHFFVQESGATQPLPPGYGPDASPPGFRYDLPTDQAVAMPEVMKPPPPAPVPPPPGGLGSHPFFAYYNPGARLFPASWFSTSLAVGDALRASCHFEAALQWYRRAFDPLRQDSTWMHCPDDNPDPAPTDDQITRQAQQLWVQHGRPADTAEQDWRKAKEMLTAAAVARATNTGTPSGACCDSTDVDDDTARARTIVLRYCATLIEWGDSLRRRRRSPEAAAQARLLYDTAARILGRRPRELVLPEPEAVPAVSAWVPAYPPLNPHLLDLYDLVADRRELVHRRLDDRRIRNGRRDGEPGYFGDCPLRDGWRTAPEGAACSDVACAPSSPYRFLSQIQRAAEIAGRVGELGAALLSAYEKVDAEYLAAIHAQQDREMLALGISIREDQWRDADWQVQALQQTKDVNQTNLLYTAGLYRSGLINDEIQNLNLTVNAMQTRTSANTIEAIGEAMNIVPDFFVGAMSTFSQIPIGTKLAGLFQVIGKVMQTNADIQATNAGLDATNANWLRRSAEWLHQMQTLQIEIEQVELQILGAQRRRDQAMDELNNQQRQLEHSGELQDFLRDKFATMGLYQWMRKETAALHARMYDLALAAAREAERAFNFERGHPTREFIPDEPWDNLHQGLMAGDRLVFALQQMEKAYRDENRRELELTKHLSLRLHFPLEYLQLRLTGHCEIDVPDWMFDLDYPGHYMRRIRNVSLTLPCVSGPYTGVHCRLTLLSSTTRVRPETRPPGHRCCEGGTGNEYEGCPNDPRIVREYAARESIATSSGQNDEGLFELNFNDERYLPFEYLGAVSRWRIELPPENNYFDLDTVTDAVLHLNYTARDGGDVLRAAAAESARHRLPGDGLRLFEVRQDFPDAWAVLRRQGPERPEGHDQERDGQHGENDRDEYHHDARPHRLDLRFGPAMFLFVPGRPDRRIEQFLVAVDAADAREGDHHVLRLHRSTEARSWRNDVVEGVCVRDGEQPSLSFATIDLGAHPLGPVSEHRSAECALELPAGLGEIRRVFIVARYTAQQDRNRNRV
jgi:hypothetical protein